MARFCIGLFLALILVSTPANAQLLNDIIDSPTGLRTARSEVAGKQLRTTVRSFPVFSSFTGLAIEIVSSAGHLEGRVRVQESDNWSEWIPLHFVRSATRGFFIAGFHGDQVWSSSEFEVEITGPSESPIVLGRSGVFDNRNDEDRAGANDTPPSPRSADAQLEDVIVPPPLITRAEWNAEPFQLGSPVPLANPTYDYMTFHHAAGYSATTYEEGLAQVKSIQDLHQNVRGWSDIGYQFVIDRSGRVYQGRPFMDSSTTLAQEPVLARGAHVGEQNTGNIGICMLGCYHPSEGSYCQETPTQESLETYVTMFAFFSERYGPTTDNIFGHRDWSSTACPGDNNYVLLPSIRQDVASLLITGNQAIATAVLTADPGEDGTVLISWEFTEDFGVFSYRIERTYAGNTIVLAEALGVASGSVSDPSITGLGSAFYSLYATSGDGRTQRVGTVEIELELPDSFFMSEAFPNPAASRSAIRFYLPYEAFVNIELYDASGRVVQLLKADYETGEKWIFSYVDVSKLTSGMYFYRIRVEGFSGNVFDETKSLVVLK